MQLCEIIWSPAPDPTLGPPWMFAVVGWNWERNRPALDPIPREMLDNYTTIRVEVPPGTILAFGQKRGHRHRKSKFHFGVVLADGQLMEISSHVISHHFAGRV